MNRMLLNCYYYAPHNHTLLPEYIRQDLARMRELGVNAVSVCVQESQLTNWHQQRLRNVVTMIHEHGMQAHAVPNRWAGLFAGWLDGFGHFTLQNQDTLIRRKDGSPIIEGEMVSCVNHPRVRMHIRNALDQMFDLFDFDGIIWDEPHSQVCYCPFCTGLCGGEPTDAWYHGRFAEFIDELSVCVKKLHPGAVTTCFVQPHQGDLLEALAATQNVDYLGSDGHVRHSSYQMHRMKGTIFDAHSAFYPLLKKAGKQTVFLPEGQRHRDEDLEQYLEYVDEAFALPADQLLFYYSAHEMSPENGSRFDEATWRAVKAAADK